MRAISASTRPRSSRCTYRFHRSGSDHSSSVNPSQSRTRGFTYRVRPVPCSSMKTRAGSRSTRARNVISPSCAVGAGSDGIGGSCVSSIRPLGIGTPRGHRRARPPHGAGGQRTVTRTRCAMLFARPWRFQGWSIGWVSPVSSVASTTSSCSPGVAVHANRQARQTNGAGAGPRVASAHVRRRRRSPRPGRSRRCPTRPDLRACTGRRPRRGRG